MATKTVRLGDAAEFKLPLYEEDGVTPYPADQADTLQLGVLKPTETDPTWFNAAPDSGDSSLLFYAAPGFFDELGRWTYFVEITEAPNTWTSTAVAVTVKQIGET